jgi:crotonobetainyl-CoA:carnitine CoA-transferase CaiB-like acyl-CoA transferase
MEEWLKAYEKIDEVPALLDENGIPNCKVNSMDDLNECPAFECQRNDCRYEGARSFGREKSKLGESA